MKALSVKQPWAELEAARAKPVEVRSVPTHYRGPFAIHASLRYDGGYDALRAWMMHRGIRDDRQALAEIRALPAGRIVALADLDGCHVLLPDDEPRALVPWRPNAWAWEIGRVRRMDSVIPVKGQLGLWNLPDGILQEAAT